MKHAHSFSKGGKPQEDLDLHLGDYLWRRDVMRTGGDAFVEIIWDVAWIYPEV